MRVAAPLSRTVETVVIVNDHATVTGGQAKVAIESALALRAAGLEVVYFAGVGPEDPRLAQTGVRVLLLGIRDILSEPNRLRAAGQGIWNWQAAAALSDILASLDADTTLIHVHGWAKALSPSIGPVVTRSLAPHVYTLHEYFLACPNGGFYDYNARAICTRRALGASCIATNCDPRNRAHKVWRLARQGVLWRVGAMPRRLEEFIYLTPAQLSILEGYLPPKARLHYLPNAVERTCAERVRAEGNRTFLFVGRLSPEKGAETVAEAARIAGVPLRLAGDGERREAVRALNPDAELLGWLSQDELLAQMKRARCLVFPSLWYETYGLVVAEALRCGIPVLVSSSTVAADLVRDGVGGFHLRPGDPVAWAARMQHLASDDLVRKLSENSFARGASLMDHSEHTEGLLRIYESAAARRRAARAASFDGGGRC